MKRMFLGLAALLLIGLLAACNEDEDKEEKKEDRIVPVETVEATQGDLTHEKSVYGRTAPNNTTPVMLQSPGEVDSLEVEDGDSVEEDDIIAKIKTPAGTQNIRAPKDGTVVNLSAKVEDMVSAEEPFALIADMETLKIQFNVTSDMRDLFEKGDKRNIKIEDKEYDAEIVTVSLMPDDSGLFPIEATMANKDANILPGTVVEISIPVQSVKDAIIVPTATIVDEGDESFVYIVTDEKAVKTKIDILETQTDDSAIKGDVKKGDLIVIKGQLTLSDDSKVNVVEAGE